MVYSRNRRRAAAAMLRAVGRWAAHRFGWYGTGVSFALRRWGGASRRPKPSVATRAITSAVTPPHGHASPTHSNRPVRATEAMTVSRSEEHTSELQSLRHLVCRLLLEKKKHLH